ncbi:fibrobacter succinogenes major paralogous domain-containing protein, partial [Flavobacteriales bacterium]|nr:fibrobacter succinogenes major paralogous domain-containing protein [Flavobacteriales bacterium]
MRLFLAMLMLMTSAALFSQVDCNLFNIQDLAADYLSFGVDTVILQSDGSYEIQLSNGTTASITLGCMDPDYTEYDASATTDDGSCSTLASTCASPSMDGHSYGVVEIGDQCWFAENLRTTVYADGAAIPEVTDNIAWAGLSTGARCDYDNNASNVATYGRMYNWYAVDDARGLCPSGWHVPTDGEWTDLENHISSQGFSGTEGAALKSMSGWG